MSTFELIAKAEANGTIPVSKYKSNKTGLTVILAAVEGPVVNGYFTLATEALDDDGLPHTLEHLIFLGSELYPYKGVLDLLANRCFASGTNAWTDTDHTCYTMTTAGKDGFRELLPIYLDHILYPTLSDSGFITEVHHVSGEGEDGGVVYCEMQGRENSGESRGFLNLLRACYPNCGYSSETGGILHNLRTSTTNRKVRKYHQEFYRPENLTIIIVGQISSDEVFASLQPVEDRIIEKMQTPLQPFERYWQKPVKPLAETRRIKVNYPSDEELVALVNFGYRGPLCSSEHLTLTACSALIHYLSHTSVSPFYKEFIEIPSAFASNINFDICENYESLMIFTFVNVPLEKVDLIEPKLNALLKRIVSGEEEIDMTRMETILDRNALEYISNLESEPHDTIAYCMIGDVLYGNSPEEFDIRLNVPRELEILKGKSVEYWIELLQKYMVDVHYISVHAIPSIMEQQNMAKRELNRIKKQRDDLGPIGLQTKAEELANAMMENEILAPNEMLTGVPVPTTDGINFHARDIYRTSDEISPPGLDLKQMPVFTEAYNVHTNFVYMIVTINTKDINPRLRPYLPLFLQVIQESPVQRGDLFIPYQDVVTALESDTISVGTRLGLESNAPFSCGPFSNTVSLMLQVEMKKYQKGVEWIVDLLQNTIFEIGRIVIVSAKMANSVSQAKRKHDTVVQNISKAMYFNDDTNVKANSLLRQYAFLNDFSEEQFQKDLEELRHTLVVAKNMAIHIATDWSKLSDMGIDLLSPWTSLLRPDDVPVREKLTVIPDWELMSSRIDVHGTVVGLGSNESAFLYHTAPCMNTFDDPDLPVLKLFLQYLTQLEGPLWRQIRGQGLAYGYHIMPVPNEGLLYMTLYKSSNIVSAYKEMIGIIQAQLEPSAVWDQTLLESAKSSLIFELIEREKNIGDLVVQALLSSFKVVPLDYNRILVERINSITTEDLERVGRQYVTPLFSDKAKTAIVCHPDKASDIAEAFSLFGRKLTFETCLDDCIFFK